MAVQQPDIDPSAMERDSDVTFKDGTEGRVYTHELLDKPVPSSSTITDTRLSPEKDKAIEGWKQTYDGSDEDSLPHWKDQLEYKGHLGTLAHYALQNAIDGVEIERGEEEKHSKKELEGWEYDGYDDAYQKALKEIDWCQRKWKGLRYGGVVETDYYGNTTEYSVDIDSVVGCEQYVYNAEWGYAGQYDLCYKQSDGVRVLADFKTSSGIRIDYKLQLALYEQAIDHAIDRWQVIRIDPDKEEVVVEDDRDWERSKQGLRNEALSLVEKTHIKRLPQFESNGESS